MSFIHSSQQVAGRCESHGTVSATRQTSCVQRGVQLMTAAPQATPASVAMHDDSFSEVVPPQHDRGEHVVQAHMTVCAMLSPGV